ncbi:uncharacterized protein [Diabrotica undecimpunctata]|uniref:uncharacterized protein n=1 Tax=Diabrotica undecimpunctata TaxID=50387 RepID=UPI003B637D82
MPRPTEIIQAEESTAPRSPLRRSCRIIAVSSPMPSEGNTLKESTEDKEVEQTGPANRGKTGSSVTKENGEASVEPSKTRSRRSSTSSENSVKTENVEAVKPIRGRRSSATREEETKKPVRGRRSSVQTEIEEEVTKPIRSRRSSVQNEKEEEEEPVKRIRGRRSSAQDDVNEEQVPARITRSRRSMSRDLVEESKEAVEPEPKRTTRSRRSSVEAEEDKVPKPVKTPMKPKRRLSVAETAAALEPIDEKEEAQSTAKRKDESVPGSSEIKMEDKTKELYVICETSFVDEGGRKSLTPKASPRLRNDETPTKGKLGKSELKNSPTVQESKGGRLTPDNITLRKSPRIQEKLEKCKSGEHTSHKKCTCCDAELTNSPSHRKIDFTTQEKNNLTCKDNLEDIYFSTKVIHNDKSIQIQMKQDHGDDDVFTSETVVVQKTETKSLISDGSDGSFQFNMSKSKYETTESEGDLNDSKASDSSDKENAHLNLEKNSKLPITAEQNVLEKLTACVKLERLQNVSTHRVSNVFRPKNVDYSFVEAMDIDTTLNLDVSKMEKSSIMPNENSKAVDKSIDDTFSLNLSDTYIENSEDKTMSKGSKTIEIDLEDETSEKDLENTLNISEENAKEVGEEKEILSLDKDKPSKEINKENGIDLKTVSPLNKAESKNAENREKITENEVNKEESQIASKEYELLTEDLTISNIEDRCTADKAATEEIEEEDDRFSETDELDRSLKSKDSRSIELKEEEEEDDRFSETKDMSEDYEFDVPSDTEGASVVIPAQSPSLRDETVKEEILNVSQDEKQSSEKIERDDEQEIDVVTLEEDKELYNEIKNGESVKDGTSDGVQVEEPTKDNHEKLTESPQISINSEDPVKESITSSVDDQLECLQKSKDSVAVEGDDCKEENNKITEDNDKYDDMKNTFQDIVQDDKDEELSTTATNTKKILSSQDLSNNQDKTEEIESNTIDNQEIETISSKSNSSSSLHELEIEETIELPEKRRTSERLKSIKTQVESIENPNKVEFKSNNTHLSNTSVTPSPKKEKKRNSEIVTIDPEKISNNREETPENNLENIKTNKENIETDQSSEISVAVSPKKGKKRNSEIITIDPAKISEEKTNNQEETPENNLENIETHKLSEISADVSPKKGKSEIVPADKVKISEEKTKNQENTLKNNLEGRETDQSSEISPALSPKKRKKRKSEIVTIDPVKTSEDSTNNQEHAPENNFENTETDQSSDILAAVTPKKGKKRKSGIVTIDPAKISEEKINNQEHTPKNNLENEKTDKSFEISVAVSPKKGKKRKSEIVTIEPVKISEGATNNQEQASENNFENIEIDKSSKILAAISPKKGKKKKSGIIAVETTEVKEKISSSPAFISKKNKENNVKTNKRFSLDDWVESTTVDDLSQSEDIETKPKDLKNKKKQRLINLDESPIDKKRDKEPVKAAKKNESGKKLNSSQFLEQYEDPRLDAELEKFLQAEDSDPSDKDSDPSDEDSDPSDVDFGISFIDDMAEEGEEDTPSEDSNAIIDEGEPINTDSERSEDEDYDDDSSFICDEGNMELLPGDEYDLANEENKKQSRIINVDDRDEDIIKIKRKIKPEAKKRKSRIIKVEDSSESEEVVDLISDQEGSVNPNSEESDQASPKTETTQGTGKPKTSIRIIENIDVKEIKDTSLSERINQLVGSFCTTIPQTGDISMNLSLEYASKASPDGKKRRSKKRKSKDFQRRSISEEETVSTKTPKLDEEVFLSESVKNVPTKPRLSVSMTEDAPSMSEKSLKRRLSKSMDDIEKEVKKHKKKKSKKSRQKAESHKKSSLNSGRDIDLDGLSFGLLQQLLTDVKNRPRRMIKPSTSRRDNLDNAWIVELGVDAKPSTSEVSKKETDEFKKQKIHPKDFRNQMLYNSSRVKRIETKQLLKKRVYF